MDGFPKRKEFRPSLFALISINISQISVHFDLQATSIGSKWIGQSALILSIFFELHPLKSKGVADAVFISNK